MLCLLFLLLFQDERASVIGDAESGGYYRATLIGINNYQHHKVLRTPVNDVVELSTVLASRYGFQTQLLLDAAASEQGIRNELERLVRTSSPDDSVLLYFAGHGTEGTSQTGYWVPSDAGFNLRSNYISNSDIISFAENCPAKHVLIISDACFSGSIFKGAGMTEETIEVMAANSLASRWVISSGNLTTVDDTKLGEKHSPFAHYLLGILETSSQPYFTPRDLVWKLVRDVARDSKRHQLPKVGPLLEAGHKGGSFVFWNTGLSDPNGNPYPPPWEAKAQDFLPTQLKMLYGRQVLIQNPGDPSLCAILREALGMTVDCDMGRVRQRRQIVTWCSEIKHEWVQALKSYLHLDRYDLKTHEDKSGHYYDEECGTEYEIVIRN